MGRNKKLRKGIESIRREIKVHFQKLEQDLKIKNLDGARYHAKELDRDLITTLENKMKILGEDEEIIKKYRERLKKLIEGVEE
jgi:hypothetical protein